MSETHFQSVLEELFAVRRENAELREMMSAMSGQVAALMQQVDTPPDYKKYTIPEAVRRLKKSESTFHRYVRDGLLRTFREGGRTYTTETYILELERRLRHGK
jgi:hypothetical protein